MASNNGVRGFNDTLTETMSNKGRKRLHNLPSCRVGNIFGAYSATHKNPAGSQFV
jgi:hypothetical protein